ncbi:carboxylating nicotinate-nucleotide diphosphorylase [bacterium BFN5]|nr:carboxylating nicotinate-nucleotide diphosphorylase [bacterium BFN5]
MIFSQHRLNRFIAQWLAEDVGSGDITTDSIVPADYVTKGIIHAKQSGVLAGIAAAQAVFRYLAADIEFTPAIQDGAKLKPQTVIATVAGNARAILTGERLALNLLQHLSGIATKTANLVELVKPQPIRVVDTRKTIPGLRLFEKYAVRVGGGANHRLGLYDAVLIKDNHIKVAGGIAAAIQLARVANSHTVKIEVEVETLAGVAEALAAQADIIMLDNMDLPTMRQAVKQIGGRALVEASGGIHEQTIAAVASTGVDVISVGALTHSVQALDISLDIDEIKGL